MTALPLRSLAFVILAPLVLLGISASLVLQALDATSAAAALQEKLAHAVSRPVADPVTRGTALLVPGTSAGMAASAFQAAVRRLASGAGAEVVQVESAPMEPAPPLSLLHLTVHLRGTEAQIVAALAALETAEPLIRTDRLDLQGDGQENGVLSATLQLSAWSAEVRP